jgi:alpha-mannosidase
MTTNKKTPMTVHLIAQAHIDPVWLWPWQAGVDETLATLRTACDLLDTYPEFIFTKGEAWAYAQIERLEPELFQRIAKHVKAGRWEIVGGWWIQPDCNLPSGFGMERQIAVGKDYFLDKFGAFPEIGYNVDSFGHAATLPGYMRAAGQKYYVMMRPGEHEMQLPARLFRWRGYENGPEVLTYRIRGAYCTGLQIDENYIRYCCPGMPEGVNHTMCFVGVGDHGGGATAEMIEWIQKHATAFDGCKLIFSSPSRFFAAVAKDMKKIPQVTGELQFHAIGCYTVERGIKTRVRRAEHLLRQAEAVLPKQAATEQASLAEAWRTVAFNQFHDTIGGTCIPSAYPQCYDQLGSASHAADETIQYELRRRCGELPPDKLQRVVLLNASDAAYDGYAEFAPWFMLSSWQDNWRLLDEKNREVSCQSLSPECLWGAEYSGRGRLLFRAKIPAGGMAVIRIDKSGAKLHAKLSATTTAHAGAITSGPVAARLDAVPGVLAFGKQELPIPRLELLEDLSDTWSHGFDRFAPGPGVTAAWGAPFAEYRGPLVSSLRQSGTIGDSQLEAEWRVYAGEPFVELRLRVLWVERRKLLKLAIDLPAASAERVDGIMGGSLKRANDGIERPLRDWTLLTLPGASKLGVVCPEVYALDASPDRVRFTLLRAAVMAHHEPNHGMALGRRFSDQGEHEFRFRFFMGGAVKEATLDAQALMLQRPLVGADLTKGMPRRY